MNDIEFIYSLCYHCISIVLPLCIHCVTLGSAVVDPTCMGVHSWDNYRMQYMSIQGKTLLLLCYNRYILWNHCVATGHICCQCVTSVYLGGKFVTIVLPLMFLVEPLCCHWSYLLSVCYQCPPGGQICYHCVATYISRRTTVLPLVIFVVSVLPVSTWGANLLPLCYHLHFLWNHCVATGHLCCQCVTSVEVHGQICCQCETIGTFLTPVCFPLCFHCEKNVATVLALC